MMKKNLIFITGFIILIVIGTFSSGCTGTDSNGPSPIVTETTYGEQYPLAFHNVFAYQEDPDCIYSITNTKYEPVNVRMTSEYEEYSTPTVTTITLEPGEEIEVPQTILMSPEKISGVKSAGKMNLHMKVEYETPGGWKVADEQTAMIDVFPMDTMVYSIEGNDGNPIYLFDYLTVFVTPGSPAVKELLGKAKEYATSDYDPDYVSYDLIRSLPGYQCTDCTDVEAAEYSDLQVKAIYNALQNDYKISYVDMESSFAINGEVQRISVPEESLNYQSANCVDGTVLFASALEALSINPYIIFVPEHVYLAWDTDEYGTNLHALETTMVEISPFEDALSEGMAELDEHWEFLNNESMIDEYYIVDIKKARDLGILPMK